MAVLGREVLHIPDAELASPLPRLWTRDEYYKLAEVGILRPDERVELIRGEIITMPPVGPEHCHLVCVLSQLLRKAFGPGFHIREEKAITLSDSEPEPDIVAAIASEEYYRRHPGSEDTHLVVEVSDNTLAFDHDIKSALYAQAGISEYWIVNIQAMPHQLEVHREPTDEGYQDVKIYQQGQMIEPLHAPGKAIAVSEIISEA